MPSTPSDADNAPNAPTAGEPDEYLIGRVHDALARELSELDVQVTVAGGGAVFLEGSVLTEGRRDAVADVVQRAVGDRAVHNQVTVAPMEEPTAVEELS
jgi:osmotically-inducible protein OsmY